MGFGNVVVFERGEEEMGNGSELLIKNIQPPFQQLTERRLNRISDLEILIL